ncbi:MAG: SpoIIE family protein phosphatase [Prevotella sp.]|nr:SpoIIE family protein phosphatase [Prevotella sp.]
MGLAYCIMGTAYSNLRDFEESTKSFEKSIKILSTINPILPVLLDAYGYYCDALNSMREYTKMDEQIISWEQTLKAFIHQHQLEATSTADLFWSYYYLACAQAAIGQGQTDRAAEMLDNMELVTPSEESYRGRTLLYYKAQLAILKRDYQQALEYNERRFRLMSDNSDQSGVVNVNYQRAEIFNHLGRYKEAADLFRTVYLISDSLNLQDTKRNLNAMNTMFGLTEMERENERMVMEQEQAQLRWIIAVALLIVVSLAIFLFFRIRAARKLRQAHSELQTAYSDLQAANEVIEETTAAKERIESELRIARDIQQSMVPTIFPNRPDLDLYASMTPAKEVGGDMYSYLLIEETQKLYFALGDVSGKGVPASLFMAQATRLFRTLAKQQMMPADIATHLNAELSEDNEQGMFITMFIGLVDLQTGHLDFCNAGHNPPVLAGQFLEMESNAPIGLWPGLDYVGEQIDNISEKPLFIYTDGLNEAENQQQEQFSDERLLELLENTPFVNSRQTIEMLSAEVEKHRDGAEPNDDLTMMCFIIKGNN